MFNAQCFRFHWQSSAIWESKLITSKGLAIIPSAKVLSNREITLFWTIAVKKMTGIEQVNRLDFKTSRTANPSIPGIIRSIRIRSGRSVSALVMPSIPSLAVKTSQSVSRSRANLTIILVSFSSSINKSRLVVIIDLHYLFRFTLLISILIDFSYWVCTFADIKILFLDTHSCNIT